VRDLACILGLLAAYLVPGEIDCRLRRACPHCRQQSLRMVGTGGLWYEEHGDVREVRVYWGQCSSCGRSATRRQTLFAPWAAFPDAEEKAASHA
jgi:hypothetical protein